MNSNLRRRCLSYLSTSSTEALIGATIPQIQRQTTEKFPDRECFKFLTPGIASTFSQFEESTNKIAAAFLAAGLKPGDRIGIWSPNHVEWIETQFAAAKAGLILVNINPSYKYKELAYVLKMCGIKGLVSDTKYGLQHYEDILQKAVSENPNLLLEFIAYRGDTFTEINGTRTFSFDNFREESDSNYVTEVEEIIHKTQMDDFVNIQFTSGTTGNPKGATLTHHNILNNALALTASNRVDVNENDSILLNVPFYHCFGCVIGSLAMMTRGARMVIPAPTFDALKGLRASAAEKTNIWYGTPTMFVDFLDHPDKSKFDLKSESGLRGVMAGAMCPAALLKGLKDEFNLRIFVAYGTTENSPVTFMSTKNDSFENQTETVGYIMPHTEAKIIDEDGATVASGQKGELCIRGPCCFPGYWNQPEKTKEVMGDDKWYKTGDLAVFTDEGYCKIVGRAKDMIIRGGENIYPAEIEALLLDHPAIADAQVVGVPSRRLGEEVAVYVRLASGKKVTPEDIKKWAMERITHFKVPKFIKIVETYPVTVTGKVRKVELRENAPKDFILDTVENIN